jgi:Kdo2-lipid IVA lauroyltransferase/acyltransferase
MDNRPLGKRIKYALIFYFVRFLIFSSNAIPRKAWLSFCGFLGSVAYYLFRETRKLTIQNLTIAYQAEKSAGEILDLGKRMFRMLGKNAGEVLRARAVRTLADLDKILIMHDYENFEKAKAKGKGVIFLTSHIGAFELEVMAMALRGLKPNIVGTALKDERLNELMYSYRNAHGAIATERGKETLRMIRALKSGGLVALLIDQDTKVKSRFVNFFGRQAATPVGVAILAMKTGAAVVPAHIHLGSDGMQHIDMMEEIPLIITGDDEKDMVSNTQNFTSLLEAQIRKYPEQWVWMHERWKTKPGEEIV